MVTRALIAVMLIACTGCEESPEPVEPTLRVAVSTDAAVPDELDGLEIIITRGGVTKFNEAYDADILSELPDTLMLSNGEDVGSEELPTPIGITLRGMKDEQAVIERQAMINFSESQAKLYAMRLCMDCAGMTCDEGETCSNGGVCSPLFVDIAEVPQDDGKASLTGIECP